MTTESMATDKTMSMESQLNDGIEDGYDVDEDGKPFLRMGWIVFDLDGETVRLGECPKCRDWFEIHDHRIYDEPVCKECGNEIMEEQEKMTEPTLENKFYDTVHNLSSEEKENLRSLLGTDEFKDKMQEILDKVIEENDYKE